MATDDDRYAIKDWTPPWLDNGKALTEIIRITQKLDDPISWQIICSLLQHQMQIDLQIAKEVNFMFNPDMNDEALPYAWDADINARRLKSFWESLTEHEFDEIEDDDAEGDLEQHRLEFCSWLRCWYIRSQVYLGLTMSKNLDDTMLTEIVMLRKENEELRQKITALQQENRDLSAFISENTTFPSTIAVDWTFDLQY